MRAHGHVYLMDHYLQDRVNYLALSKTSTTLYLALLVHRSPSNILSHFAVTKLYFNGHFKSKTSFTLGSHSR